MSKPLPSGECELPVGVLTRPSFPVEGACLHSRPHLPHPQKLQLFLLFMLLFSSEPLRVYTPCHVAQLSSPNSRDGSWISVLMKRENGKRIQHVNTLWRGGEGGHLTFPCYLEADISLGSVTQIWLLNSHVIFASHISSRIFMLLSLVDWRKSYKFGLW